MTDGLRRQLARNIGKIVRVHPRGDFINSITGPLKRENGCPGVNTGWYVEGVQIPIRKINSAMLARGCLDIEINPDYFQLNINELYFR